MSNIALTVEQINALQPLDIVKNETVCQRFIQIYDTLWGEGEGEKAYERESTYFNRILSDNEKLATSSTRFSIFTAFIDLAVCGLSLEPGTRALCYLQGRNYKVGETVGSDGKKRNVYEGRLTLTVSGYGELVLRARCGQIKYADNPVLVYEQDEFSFSDKDGHKSVNYTCRLPHTNNHIVAAFLRITRSDGSVDYSVMLEEDWLRLKGYSGKNNRRWDERAGGYVETPNELYTSNGGGIDTGFLCAKVIKHAFKSYPKVRIGRGTELETQREEPADDDYYGVKEEPAMPKKQESFAEPENLAEGVKITPATDGKKDDGAFF